MTTKGRPGKTAGQRASSPTSQEDQIRWRMGGITGRQDVTKKKKEEMNGLSGVVILWESIFRWY